MTLSCYICKKTDLIKGVWAFHDDLPPKTDLAICANCWYKDKNLKIHYNGNLDSEDYHTHFPSPFHDTQVTIWATTPIMYRKKEDILIIYGLSKGNYVTNKGILNDKFEKIKVLKPQKEDE